MLHNPLQLNLPLTDEVRAAIKARAEDLFYVEEGSTYCDGMTFDAMLDASATVYDVWRALTREGDDGLEGMDQMEAAESLGDALNKIAIDAY
jgi:hypothetical protein